MTSYDGDTWNVPATSCPECSRVQQSQGFEVVVDETQPLCSTCSDQKRLRDFHASEVFQAWLRSLPAILTNEEYTAWVLAHPPPSQT